MSKNLKTLLSTTYLQKTCTNLFQAQNVWFAQEPLCLSPHQWSDAWLLLWIFVWLYPYAKACWHQLLWTQFCVYTFTTKIWILELNLIVADACITNDVALWPQTVNVSFIARFCNKSRSTCTLYLPWNANLKLKLWQYKMIGVAASPHLF